MSISYYSFCTVIHSPLNVIGYRFPKACFNKLKVQKSIEGTSEHFTSISLNGMHFIPVSDSFFAK